ncbi:MAG: metal ABC transporter permease [Anaerolineae bacterium]|nr:metal ABC transporter permease [Phycisphaerae bacterium]
MTSELVTNLIASGSLATACAVLSVIVVVRRWAFVGEGISHSGFGGAGTAWLLALLVPAMDQLWVTYLAVVVFCLVTALSIGRMSRWRPVTSDAAVGVFLVASLAWGFVAQQIYLQRTGRYPAAFEALLFGRMSDVSPQFALVAAAVCGAVLIVIALLAKEIIAYCFDPLTAQTSGVQTNLIHDLLMILLAIVIVIGARISGSVLIVALLVLPGATALLLSQRLNRVIATSIAIALLGAIAGVLVSKRWSYVPTGPAIVLALFVQFVIATLVSKTARIATA